MKRCVRCEHPKAVHSDRFRVLVTPQPCHLFVPPAHIVYRFLTWALRRAADG